MVVCWGFWDIERMCPLRARTVPRALEIYLIESCKESIIVPIL